MPQFNIQDLSHIDTAPTSPGSLRTRVGAMIDSSTVCRAKVDAINPETGEYRVVLQGTLDRNASKFEQD